MNFVRNIIKTLVLLMNFGELGILLSNFKNKKI